MLSHGDASRAVPHITNLNEVAPRQRLTSKVHVEKSFALAWRHYIRGHIVSNHAKKIIAQFMAACCGKSKTDAIFLGEQATMPNPFEKAEACSVSLHQVHRVLREAASHGKRRKVVEGEQDDMNEASVSEQMRCSLRLGSALWSIDATSWSDDTIQTGGHREMKDSRSSGASPRAPKKHARLPEKVSLRVFERSSAAWLEKIMNEEMQPNAEQLAYLLDIRDRCAVEASETTGEGNIGSHTNFTEPYRKCLLGPPGTGKSECIRWTRRFFEEVMGWDTGVHFQMLAPQHTMALLIGGRTHVHNVREHADEGLCF